MRIGIDFDNTLACYDHLFAAAAAAHGLSEIAAGEAKRVLRDSLRGRPEGELAWQAVQAEIYGARMADAVVRPGAGEFLLTCRAAGAAVFVISHKTKRAAADSRGIDLHLAALNWMTDKGFFAADGYGLDPACVFFEPTRPAKIARIAALRCTHFIDDLEEVLCAPDFPSGVRRYLIGGPPSGRADLKAYSTWQGISDDVFRNRAA